MDPLGRQALRPFHSVDQLVDGCQKIFQRMDRDLGSLFDEMRKMNLLDLASRKGKAPGGYQSALSESRKPFIFMNAVGVDQDLRTLLHESGHAFHALLSAPEPIVDYRHAPMEFNEVASMSMELLADKYLDVFYTPEEGLRSQLSHLEDVVFVLAWVANIDAFQHWIYENPEHSPEERRRKWNDLYLQYSGGLTQWDGHEEIRDYLWHRQLHIFEVPFYYIEYGIAQLGALQLWLNARDNHMKALKNYKGALSLGGTKPLPEIFETAGIQFDFSINTIRPLAEKIDSTLDELYRF
ncbi:MAG: hypothetical protein KC713_04440 [Candidatus Omnitrophica bacterium]|nr:hypothetical protein [Candidatus Omnitrophota bacterium]